MASDKDDLDDLRAQATDLTNSRVDKGIEKNNELAIIRELANEILNRERARIAALAGYPEPLDEEQKARLAKGEHLSAEESDYKHMVSQIQRFENASSREEIMDFFDNLQTYYYNSNPIHPVVNGLNFENPNELVASLQRAKLRQDVPNFFARRWIIIRDAIKNAFVGDTYNGANVNALADGNSAAEVNPSSRAASSNNLDDMADLYSADDLVGLFPEVEAKAATVVSGESAAAEPNLSRIQVVDNNQIYDAIPPPKPQLPLNPEEVAFIDKHETLKSKYEIFKQREAQAEQQIGVLENEGKSTDNMKRFLVELRRDFREEINIIRQQANVAAAVNASAEPMGPPDMPPPAPPSEQQANVAAAINPGAQPLFGAFPDMPPPAPPSDDAKVAAVAPVSQSAVNSNTDIGNFVARKAEILAQVDQMKADLENAKRSPDKETRDIFNMIEGQVSNVHQLYDNLNGRSSFNANEADELGLYIEAIMSNYQTLAELQHQNIAPPPPSMSAATGAASAAEISRDASAVTGKGERDNLAAQIQGLKSYLNDGISLTSRDSIHNMVLIGHKRTFNEQIDKIEDMMKLFDLTSSDEQRLKYLSIMTVWVGYLKQDLSRFSKECERDGIAIDQKRIAELADGLQSAIDKNNQLLTTTPAVSDTPVTAASEQSAAKSNPVLSFLRTAADAIVNFVTRALASNESTTSSPTRPVGPVGGSTTSMTVKMDPNARDHLPTIKQNIAAASSDQQQALAAPVTVELLTEVQKEKMKKEIRVFAMDLIDELKTTSARSLNLANLLEHRGDRPQFNNELQRFERKNAELIERYPGGLQALLTDALKDRVEAKDAIRYLGEIIIIAELNKDKNANAKELEYFRAAIALRGKDINDFTMENFAKNADMRRIADNNPHMLKEAHDYAKKYSHNDKNGNSVNPYPAESNYLNNRQQFADVKNNFDTVMQNTAPVVPPSGFGANK